MPSIIQKREETNYFFWYVVYIERNHVYLHSSFLDFLYIYGFGTNTILFMKITNPLLQFVFTFLLQKLLICTWPDRQIRTGHCRRRRNVEGICQCLPMSISETFELKVLSDIEWLNGQSPVSATTFSVSFAQIGLKDVVGTGFRMTQVVEFHSVWRLGWFLVFVLVKDTSDQDVFQQTQRPFSWLSCQKDDVKLFWGDVVAL